MIQDPDGTWGWVLYRFVPTENFIWHYHMGHHWYHLCSRRCSTIPRGVLILGGPVRSSMPAGQEPTASRTPHSLPRLERTPTQKSTVPI